MGQTLGRGALAHRMQEYLEAFVDWVVRRLEDTVEQSVIKDLSMLRRRAKDDDVDQLLEDWDLDGIESEKVATIEPHDRIRLGIALASIGSPSTIVIDDIETGMGAQDTLHMLNYLSNVAKTQGIAFVIGLSDDLYAKYADECIAIGS